MPGEGEWVKASEAERGQHQGSNRAERIPGEQQGGNCVAVTEAGSYFRRIDFCITQLKAQGPSRTCNESKEEEEYQRSNRAAIPIGPVDEPEIAGLKCPAPLCRRGTFI